MVGGYDSLLDLGINMRSLFNRQQPMKHSLLEPRTPLIQVTDS